MKIVSLGDIVQFASGGTPARSRPEYYRGDIPWVTGADITPEGNILERHRISREAVSQSATTVASPGALLLVTRTSVGKVARVKDSVAFSQDITAILPDALVCDVGYIEHFLRSRQTFLVAQARGATIRGITRQVVASLRMELPPLAEQRRIAALLDGVATLRRQQESFVTACQDAKASLFNKYIESDTTTARDMKPLAAVVRDGTVVTYGIVQAGPDVEDGVPYIRTGDLVDGQIAVNQLRKTSPEIAERFKRSRVSVGDIVMSIRATVGTTAMVPLGLEGANLTQGTARIAPGPRLHPLFLLEYLRSPRAQRWIQAQVKGATFREITLARLRQLPVVQPPMEVQQRFVSALEAVEAMAQISRRKSYLLTELHASLQHRAFSGEL
ncbi:restriction endonuclease subunit S [Kineococcus sp. G2]|uniref:restriction endonuclease subunit S n=1 Tax=Kineococcus sp. G2 TaxID=3127484 RepID=UPI00301D4A46